MEEKKKLLSSLPSVHEILGNNQGAEWLNNYPRRYVIQAIREVIDQRRKDILKGLTSDISEESMLAGIEHITKARQPGNGMRNPESLYRFAVFSVYSMNRER